MLGLAGARPEAIVKHLPQIFDNIVELLVQPPRVSGHMINVGSTCFETLCLLLENVSVSVSRQAKGLGYLAYANCAFRTFKSSPATSMGATRCSPHTSSTSVICPTQCPVGLRGPC